MSLTSVTKQIQVVNCTSHQACSFYCNKLWRRTVVFPWENSCRKNGNTFFFVVFIIPLLPLFFILLFILLLFIFPPKE